MPRKFDLAIVDRHVAVLRDAGFVVEQRGQQITVSLNREISLVEVQQVIDGAQLSGQAQRGDRCVVVEVRQ